MAKITKAKVVRALRDAGFDVDIFYDRAHLQWYFCGPEAMTWKHTGTMCNRLDDWPLEWWVEEARQKREEV